MVNVLQTAWKVGKDGIEAGTSLVQDSVPRPVARISVTVVALTLSLFVLKSFLSTAFFVLATMGLAYFIFIALNKDDRSRGSGGSTSTSTENPINDFCGITSTHITKQAYSNPNHILLQIFIFMFIRASD
ncbi:hypothetical protein QYF36_023248 [Acer negundo]|nr:hypothetical protein QYF36_023248 [Acer negundo]